MRIDRILDIFKRYGNLLLGLLILAGLYVIGLSNYLLFHSLVELFSIVVAGSVFVLAWNSQRFQQNSYVLMIGISLLFIGGLDLVHTLAYKGMGVFAADANLPTQLWIAARYLQAFSFLLAPIFLRRQVPIRTVFAAYTAITSLLLLSIFAWGIFPDCYIEGSGLTPFKRISEYIISAILLVSAGLLLRRRWDLHPVVLRFLVMSIVLSIASELAFSDYIGVYGTANMIGHFLKVVAFYLIYKAIIVTGLEHPFSVLFRDLSEARDRAERQSDELEAIINSMTEALILYDSQGVVRRANPTTEEWYGFDPVGVHREEIATRLQIRRLDGLPARQQELPSTLALSGNTVRNHPFNFTNPHGEERTILASGSPLVRDGQLVGAVVVWNDITERRQAETAAQAYAQQLESRNRELQDFAFVASHDLQEPLRKILAFGDRLKVKYAPVLGEEGRDYLDRMQNAAGRMQDMINGLLAYSRVTTKGLPFQCVDLDRIVREVVSDLEIRIEQTGGQVEVGRLPEVEADPLQMRQLFQNLIGNGLKFHRPEAAPTVRVYTMEKQNEVLGEDGHGDGSAVPFASPLNSLPILSAPQVEITVEDNGIGFEEKYLNRIFQPFHRLHGRSEYEGTGIGLAICRKIVERHAGGITARSAPGQGAAFIVTLPVKQKH